MYFYIYLNIYTGHHIFKQYNKHICIPPSLISHFSLAISMGHPHASAYGTILHSKAGVATGILQKRNSDHLSDNVSG